MYKLLYKDWIVGRAVLAGIFLLMPFLVSMALWVMIGDFGGIHLSVLTGIVVILSIFFSFVLLLVEAGTQSESMLLSLPLHRSSAVIARYTTTFLLIAYSLLLAWLTVYLHQWLFQMEDPALPVLLSFKGLLIFYVGLLMMLSFIFPFMYKMGSGKGIIVALTIQLGLPLLKPVLRFFAGVFEGVFIFDINDLIQLTQNAMRWVGNQSTIFLIMLFGSVVILFIYLSLLLSIRFYSRRDI